MLASRVFLSALGATAVVAAPVYPDLNLAAAMPGSLDTMTEYFTMLSNKVQQSRLMASAPICDLSKAVLPTSMLQPAQRW